MQNINPSECEYHVDYYDICLKNCFYCKDNIKDNKCPMMTDKEKGDNKNGRSKTVR